MTDYPVEVNADDWYEDSISGVVTGTTTLYTYYDNTLPGGLQRTAYFKINTSAIPDTDEVSSATFNFYASSYASSRGVSKVFNVWIDTTGSGSSYTIVQSNVAYSSAGWYQITIPSNLLQYINKDGYTYLRISAQDPGGSYYRRMDIQARESTFGIYKAYLAVTHAPPPVESGQVIRLICS